MEWLTCIRKAVDFMENHLEDDISAQDVAAEVNMSSFFFQKGFSLMTGFGIGEYIRNRRLYRAAVDLQKTDEKIIDIALRYCYETPESFAKAFSRFHGSSPSQVRAGSVVVITWRSGYQNSLVYDSKEDSFSWGSDTLRRQ